MNIVIDIRDMQLERVGVSVYCENIILEILKIKDKYKNLNFIFIGSKEMKKVNISPYRVEYIAPSVNSSMFEKIIWYYKLPKILKLMNAQLYFGAFQKLPFMKYDCKLVYTLHDAASITQTKMINGIISKYKNKFFVKNWVNAANGVICISKFCLEEFSSIIDKNLSKKSKIIYHGLPNEIKVKKDFISNTKPDFICSDKRYIMTVGTIYPKKNIKRLIESLNYIDENIILIVCGQAGYNSEEIFEYPQKLNLQDRVIFLGRVDNLELKAVFHYSDLFVFPSLYEGFGIPLLEAFFEETPVVCSNVTSLPEIAGDAAMYFNPYDVKDMAAKIIKMLNSKELSKEFIKKGKERLKKFSWKNSAEAHLSFFKEVCSNEN